MSSMTVSPTFAFGENWDDFVRRHLSEERVALSVNHLLSFLGLADLGGRSFLDVGCGSGLHSLAALRAGAARIVSFDIDPESLAATRRLREMNGAPVQWTVVQGSVLDATFMAALERADIVYAWGSLHHTGAMWTAVEQVVDRIAPGGLMYLALYTTDRDSAAWVERKRRYNLASPASRRLMEARYLLVHAMLPDLLRLRNPLRWMRERRRNRGMAYMTDVRDWLGGYPFEHARIEEVLRFCHGRFGLELVNIATGEANTEYLFRRGPSAGARPGE